MEDQLPDAVSNQLSRKERAFLQHRGEIISAAESVFAEKGYVSTTMEEIARRSEFAHPAAFPAHRSGPVPQRIRIQAKRQTDEVSDSPLRLTARPPRIRDAGDRMRLVADS